MKNKNRQKKSIREIETRKKYNGEASPYWEYIQNHPHMSLEGQPEENVFANPDLLGEDEHLYHRPLTERGEFQFQVVREALKGLSPQQQKVLQLYGFDGLALKAVAKELGITLSTAQTFLVRARRTIKRAYYAALRDHQAQ